MRKLADIVDDIADRSGVTKQDVKAVLEAQSHSIKDNLNEDGEHLIYEVGTMKTADRPARKGRNPQTGETIDIAASTNVKIKAAKSLKDAVQK